MQTSVVTLPGAVGLLARNPLGELRNLLVGKKSPWDGKPANKLVAVITPYQHRVYGVHFPPGTSKFGGVANATFELIAALLFYVTYGAYALAGFTGQGNLGGPVDVLIHCIAYIDAKFFGKAVPCAHQ